MIPTFNICQKDGCKITLTGLSQDDGLYLKEDSIVQPYNKFKYSDTVTINVVLLNKIDSLTVVDSVILDHCVKLDEWHVGFKEDGYHFISHIILPTIECLERIYQDDEDFLNHYDRVYAVNGQTIVKLVDNKWIESSVEELVEVNNNNSTIFKAQEELFSICFLWQCYVDLCKELLSSNLTECKSKNNDLETLIFNRDFIWMTINVINYYILKDQLYEAQRILEEVKGCNGFCNESNQILKKKGGCGCGK